MEKCGEIREDLTPHEKGEDLEQHVMKTAAEQVCCKNNKKCQNNEKCPKAE